MSTHAELERVWKDRVEEFKACGLSQAEWCRRHGLRPKRLSYWFGKFQKADMQPEEEAQWLQVEMGGPEVPTSVIEIKIGKALIEVTPGFDSELLAKVVQTLATC
ncbi:MAG: helix-turn-helix domain-containing protein [Firmicutes bacterium]|nr:helix-turn-helix domain-containing protein [Bacillota bacterium]